MPYPIPEDEVRFGVLHSDGTYEETARIKQEDIKECPHFIMAPEHYEVDGTCKCDDPTHTVMHEWGYQYDDELQRWV